MAGIDEISVFRWRCKMTDTSPTHEQGWAIHKHQPGTGTGLGDTQPYTWRGMGDTQPDTQTGLGDTQAPALNMDRVGRFSETSPKHGQGWAILRYNPNIWTGSGDTQIPARHMDLGDTQIPAQHLERVGRYSDTQKTYHFTPPYWIQPDGAGARDGLHYRQIRQG